jgi:hypothetical protein
MAAGERKALTGLYDNFYAGGQLIIDRVLVSAS